MSFCFFLRTNKLSFWTRLLPIQHCQKGLITFPFFQINNINKKRLLDFLMIFLLLARFCVGSTSGCRWPAFWRINCQWRLTNALRVPVRVSSINCCVLQICFSRCCVSLARLCYCKECKQKPRDINLSRDPSESPQPKHVVLLLASDPPLRACDNANSPCMAGEN